MSVAGERSLPHDKGMTFSTLDAYLMHLQELSAQDVPYYREVSPGKYQLETGRGSNRPGVEKLTFTRTELMAKFGFTK